MKPLHTWTRINNEQRKLTERTTI